MSQMAVYSVGPCQLLRERFTPTTLHNGALARLLDSSNAACAKYEFAAGLVVYMCCEQRVTPSYQICGSPRYILSAKLQLHHWYARARKLLHFR
jgi:hypothetical protein